MITQDNEILDYETCKLLKKVGFDEPCEQLYSTAIRHNGEDLSFEDEMDLKSEGLDDEIEYIEGRHPYPYDGLADSYESAAKDAILFFVKNVLYHRYYNKNKTI